MGKPTELTVSVSYKKGLPNYGSINFHASVTMPIGETETHKKVYKEAWDIVGTELSTQLELFNEQEKSGMQKGLG